MNLRRDRRMWLTSYLSRALNPSGYVKVYSLALPSCSNRRSLIPFSMDKDLTQQSRPRPNPISSAIAANPFRPASNRPKPIQG